MSRGSLVLGVGLPLLGCGDGGGSGAIALGTAFWVHTNPDEPALDARVDVGTLRGVGPSTVEVTIEFPSSPGVLATLRSMHPDLDLPDGAFTRERERVVCGSDGKVTTPLETIYLAADGREVARRSWPANGAPGVIGYGADPRSLACLAAASKCRGQPLSWPPPANTAQLNDSREASEQRAAYSAAFVPTCIP